jgi:hypothetical protein
MKPFFSQGSTIGDDPVYSILLCFIVCQIALFCNVSQLAIHITTVSLLVFACINLACFTLRVSTSFLSLSLSLSFLAFSLHSFSISFLSFFILWLLFPILLRSLAPRTFAQVLDSSLSGRPYWDWH